MRAGGPAWLVILRWMVERGFFVGKAAELAFIPCPYEATILRVDNAGLACGGAKHLASGLLRAVAAAFCVR